MANDSLRERGVCTETWKTSAAAAAKKSDKSKWALSDSRVQREDLKRGMHLSTQRDATAELVLFNLMHALMQKESACCVCLHSVGAL